MELNINDFYVSLKDLMNLYEISEEEMYEDWEEV